MIDIFGIGNPLIDIIAEVTDEDLSILGLDKGIMCLVDLDERAKILERVQDRSVVYRSGGSCPNTLIFLSALGINARVLLLVKKPDRNLVLASRNIKRLALRRSCEATALDVLSSDSVIITKEAAEGLLSKRCEK